MLNPQKHYVLISLIEHESVFSFMEAKSYQDQKDYIYIGKVTELKNAGILTLMGMEIKLMEVFYLKKKVVFV